MYSPLGGDTATGVAKGSIPAYLPPESEAYHRPDYTCCNACLISGVCCKDCALCSGPKCFPASWLRRKVSTNKRRYDKDGFALDLIYLTPSILVHGFPAVGPEVMWRNPRSELLRFFDTRHADHYRIYNFACEPGRVYPRHEFHGRTRLFPFLDHNAPTLGMIVDFCEDAAAFLQAHPQNVVGLHCKAGKGRSGLMACCLLQRMGVVPSAKEAMNYYDSQRVKPGKRGLTVPTQRRYVRYYQRLLACGISSSLQVLSPTRILRKVVLRHHAGDASTDELVLKVHAGVTKEHVLVEAHTTVASGEFLVEVPLTGNTFLAVYRNGKLVADCWFHTWFVGRLCGQEATDEDTPAAFAAEVEAVTGQPPASHVNGTGTGAAAAAAAAAAADVPADAGAGVRAGAATGGVEGEVFETEASSVPSDSSGDEVPISPETSMRDGAAVGSPPPTATATAVTAATAASDHGGDPVVLEELATPLAQALARSAEPDSTTEDPVALAFSEFESEVQAAGSGARTDADDVASETSRPAPPSRGELADDGEGAEEGKAHGDSPPRVVGAAAGAGAGVGEGDAARAVAEELAEETTMDSAVNMLWFSKGDLDKHKKAPPSSEPVLLLHFEPLTSAATMAANRTATRSTIATGPGTRAVAVPAAVVAPAAAAAAASGPSSTPTAV